MADKLLSFPHFRMELVTCRKLSHWGWQPSNFRNVFTLPKTSIIGLAFGENRIIISVLVLKLYYNVTDGWRDRIHTYMEVI